MRESCGAEAPGRPQSGATSSCSTTCKKAAVKSKYIALRLRMAFAVLIAALLGIGQSGLRRLKQIKETHADITGRRLDKLQL
jgi:hypothetical protein